MAVIRKSNVSKTWTFFNGTGTKATSQSWVRARMPLGSVRWYLMARAHSRALRRIFSTGNYAKLSPVTRIDERSLQSGRFYHKACELYWAFAHR